jgi:hypothetical protein
VLISDQQESQQLFLNRFNLKKNLSLQHVDP